MVDYNSSPQIIGNSVAVPIDHAKILKSKDFKERYRVPSHEVDNESIKSYSISCDLKD